MATLRINIRPSSFKRRHSSGGRIPISLDLLDTNIWLERLLNQERSREVGDYLTIPASDQIRITDFSLHSIGIALSRAAQIPVLVQFVQGTLIDRAVTVVTLPHDRYGRLGEVMAEWKLDYDDAYQYTIAEYLNVRLVSFDSDFDRTPLGRTTPAEILAAVT